MTPIISFVSPTGAVSGAEVVLLNLIDEGLSRGATVQCLAPAGDLAELLPSTVRWVELPEQVLGTGPRPLAAGALAAAARKASPIIRAATEGNDAVVVNGFLALPSVRLSRCAPPVTWIVHDVLRRADWFAVLKAVKPSIARAVAVSHSAAKPLAQRGIPVRVVPNGTIWPVEPRGDKPPATTVGCVAALTPWKGHESLLEAFAMLEHRETVLELAGLPFAKDHDYAEALRRRAGQPDLAGRVKFLGRVDALSTMRRWTIGVSPSIEPEAMPLVVLEAMSVGLPMVATAHGGSLELLGHAGGFLVPPSEPELLAKAMDALLDSPLERRRMARWGRTEVEQHYQLGIQVARQLDAIAGVTW